MTAETSDYFSFFGLPVSLNIDPAALRKVFLENSRRFHPDFHTLASESAQAEALEWSTLNNQAYKTLSDPDKRLQYVLQLKGLLGASEALPQAFLLEVMELNENMMELEFDPSPEGYQNVQNAVQTLENSILSLVQPLLSNWSDETGNPGDLEKLQEYFLKKQYLLRVKENLSKFASAFQ